MNTATAKLASVLLQYPTAALFDGFTELTAFAAETGPKPARRHLCRFLDWLGATAPDAVAQHYVQTFDLRRRCALYLTYYRYGDTRKRGMAMVIVKTAYRDAGYVPDDQELPDYLPMMLDFAALCPRGARLLTGHRTDLELLRRGLAAADSPYADVVAAVIAALPKLGRYELNQVRSAWESGPPQEDVGLEPFAPPDYLAGYGAAPTASLGADQCRT
ncbi:nitrate reductase molybdenum cofactor assembly chaperone [Mycolicibacillus parakoreensis]|uniref:Nitrate reductase molybdenum cofactor assembly chaperone n=1 Tax=Mycolicibacillus parakoreensis TaxID=1069221 RepID=A0ABY3U2R4_9MYCO|nr:nitrate reductase molybdenum cofactor assembly chaperone [Mycolicibacillus parakoreensis]MCV7315711.1 nitrate reductase molybdenum cofactor assembly chaperone [Mycolicibacillus parakoreensis]ULN51852.1 nitrate reductase molybdenum cofactor assembly chaperone [Mycolicibacillus parakoreensis]